MFVRVPHSRSKARWDYRTYYPVAIILKIGWIVDNLRFEARMHRENKEMKKRNFKEWVPTEKTYLFAYVYRGFGNIKKLVFPVKKR